jgi:putative copper resistance protein D
MDSARPTGRATAGVTAPAVLAVAAGAVGALAVLVVALAVGRATESAAGASWVTGWGLPAARLGLDISALGTVGVTFFAAFLGPPDGGGREQPAARAVRAASWWALAWTGTATVTVVLTFAEITGAPVASALSPVALARFVAEVEQGRALLLVMGLAGTLAVSARWMAVTARNAGLLLVLAAAATLPPPLTGHTAAPIGRELATVSLVVHVLAVSAWIGGLGALLVHGRGSPTLPATASRFSAWALGLFLAVGLSGLLNAWVRLGGGVDAWAHLWASRYGWLVLGKTAAFAGLGWIGWWHRSRTLPALTAGRSSAFHRLIAGELVVMVLTVALSRSPPPVPQAGHPTHGHAAATEARSAGARGVRPPSRRRVGEWCP